MAGRAPVWVLLLLAAGAVAGAIFFLTGRPPATDGDGADGGEDAPPAFTQSMDEGRAALAASRWNVALEAADRAWRALRTSAEPFLLRGEAYAGLAQYEEAEAAFRTAMERDPNAGQAPRGVGRILLRRILYATYAPVPVTEGRRLTHLLRRDRGGDLHDPLVDMFGRAVLALPVGSPERQLGLAVDEFLGERFGACATALPDAGDFDSLLLRGYARLMDFDVLGAREDFRRAGAITREDPALRAGWAAAEWFTGHEDRALEISAGLPEIEGLWLAASGRDDEAVDRLSRVDDPACRTVLGLVHLRHDAFDRAAEALTAAYRAGYEPARYPLFRAAAALGRAQDQWALVNERFAVVWPEIFDAASRLQFEAALEASRRADAAQEAGRREEADRFRNSALSLWVTAWNAFNQFHRLSSQAAPRFPWTDEQGTQMERDLSAQMASAGTDPGLLIMRATLRFSRGDAEAALRDARTAEQVLRRAGVPPEQQAQFEAPIAYWSARILEAQSFYRVEEALEKRERCWSLDPRHRPNDFALVAHELRTEQTEAAAGRMGQLIRLEPLVPEFRTWREFALEEMGAWEEGHADALARDWLGDEEAPAAVARILFLRPEGRAVEDRLDEARHPQEVLAALEALRAAMGPREDSTDWEAEAASAQEDLDSAATDPERAAARRRLGRALVHLGHLDEAELPLLAAADAEGDAASLYLVGRIRWMRGSDRAADEVLRAAVARDAGLAQAYGLLAAGCAMRGEVQQGNVWLARLLRTAPGRPFDADAIPIVDRREGSQGRDVVEARELRSLLEH